MNVAPAASSGRAAYVALDLGGTQMSASVGTADGRLEVVAQQPSGAARGFVGMWPDVAAMTREAVAAVAVRHGGPPAAIGISIGGPIEDGVVYSPPNLPGWDAIPIADELASLVGCPAFAEHDAKAGAMAEVMFGSHRGARNLAFLTLGTGLGAGLVIDGRLVHGRRNNIGEIGHWRIGPDGADVYGKPGCWEGLCSGAGLAAEARSLGHWGSSATAADVFDAARAGDAVAGGLVGRFADALGAGTALVVDLLSPEVVVLGSLAVRAGDLFLDRVQAVVDAECTPRNLPCPVVPSSLGADIGAYAALAIAISGADGRCR